jgi:phosphatidylserine decarboxylase
VDLRRPSVAGAAYSAFVGWGARRRVPSALRPPAYRVFARAVGADLGEAELELRAYATFGDLFVRRLRAGARRIDPTPGIVVAPCDGVVAAAGQASGGTMIQAKGRGYSLDELVADRRLADRLVDGAYATIYLSPRDYHRVHAPLDARVVRYHYLPGALWPVNPRVAARRDRLLARNERVVIELDVGGVAVAVVMVGASGVGNIDLVHGQLRTQSAAWRASAEPRTRELDERVRRGDELAAFRLGSTVVLVLAPHAGDVALTVDQVVRVGERIGRFAPEGPA